MRKRNHYPVAVLLLLLALLFGGCSYVQSGLDTQAVQENTQKSYESTDIPAYAGNSFVILDDNKPAFSKQDRERTDAFETYSDLDELGRCGVAYANICKELMPTEERGAIGMVKPTGWHTVKYDNVEGKYLYNRCHLIGYQLAGENANEKNLITGTRYLNVTGMLKFEDRVADYVKATDHHVLYRVTPVFEGDNLVATGLEMEAYSVEDCGKGVSFHVFVYNIQPGITIDYATGESWTDDSKTEENTEAEDGYVLNTNTHKFHKENCESVRDIAGSNKEVYTGNREDLINMGYEPCKRCKP
ncbi:MAG: DNA/RNA non-specific endonuclease [Lachnobacterium sp.]|nr:DNA/RNA non-specific endonuclease [Lachnobacterium sp.]